MSGYRAIAAYYDLLTSNVDYKAYCSYISKQFQEHAVKGIVLDAGCGTGTMLFLLSGMGYDMVGVDQSLEMLSLAADKNPGVLLLSQNLLKLDLYGTIGAAISTLDVVNHLASLDAVEKFFSRISLFMEKGGVFIFDMNLPYKHDVVLADNAFVFELPDGILVWQNEGLRDRVKISLDLFLQKNDDNYKRSSDQFFEYTYSLDLICRLSEKSGFQVSEILDGETFLPLTETSERAILSLIKL